MGCIACVDIGNTRQVNRAIKWRSRHGHDDHNQGGSFMADLTLYHIAPSRSSVALWMLEEIGEPYDIHLLSMKRGTNREPAYLAVNPMGKVPALCHRDVVIIE